MMKRMIGAGLVGLFMLGSVGVEAQEEEASSEVEFAFDARIRPRLEARFNHHFGLDPGQLRYGGAVDDGDIFSQQSRLVASLRRGKLRGRMTVQHSARWGDFSGAQMVIPPLHLYEGWMRYEATEQFFVEVGRFELTYGEQRALGNGSWNQVGRSWDGVRFGARPGERAAVDLFGVKVREGQEGFLGGDGYLAGIYAVISEVVPDIVEGIDLYLLYNYRDGDEAEAEPWRHLAMGGARVYGGVSLLEVEGEGAVQFGSRCEVGDEGCAGEAQPIGAYFFDVELGLGLSFVRPFVGFSMASGDDPATDRFEGYDPLYGAGHKWMGLMDIIGGRTNMREIRAGLAMEVEGLGARLVFHDFTRLQPSVENVGQEIDLILSYGVSDGFLLEVGQGIFIPGEGIAIGDEAPEGVASWSFVQAVGSF